MRSQEFMDLRRALIILGRVGVTLSIISACKSIWKSKTQKSRTGGV